MSSLPGAVSSSSRWIRQDEPRVPYALAGPQKAAAVSEASSTPPALPEPASKLNLVRRPARPMIRVHGEPFYVEHEGDEVYIVHDRWSLLGSGDSLAAAYKDLLFEASEVAPVYTATPPSKLDAEGARLAKFLFYFR